MKIENAPFQMIDWPVEHLALRASGRAGVAHWRTLEVGNVRVRIVRAWARVHVLDATADVSFWKQERATSSQRTTTHIDRRHSVACGY
jgi:hypothetical protein